MAKFEETMSMDFMSFLNTCPNPTDAFADNKHSKLLSEKWFMYLVRYKCETAEERRLCNMYMHKFVNCLRQRQLTEPFLVQPVLNKLIPIGDLLLYQEKQLQQQQLEKELARERSELDKQKRELEQEYRARQDQIAACRRDCATMTSHRSAAPATTSTESSPNIDPKQPGPAMNMLCDSEERQALDIANAITSAIASVKAKAVVAPLGVPTDSDDHTPTASDLIIKINLEQCEKAPKEDLTYQMRGARHKKQPSEKPQQTISHELWDIENQQKEMLEQLTKRPFGADLKALPSSPNACSPQEMPEEHGLLPPSHCQNCIQQLEDQIMGPAGSKKLQKSATRIFTQFESNQYSRQYFGFGVSGSPKQRQSNADMRDSKCVDRNGKAKAKVSQPNYKVENQQNIDEELRLKSEELQGKTEELQHKLNALQNKTVRLNGKFGNMPPKPTSSQRSQRDYDDTSELGATCLNYNDPVPEPDGSSSTYLEENVARWKIKQENDLRTYMQDLSDSDEDDSFNDDESALPDEQSEALCVTPRSYSDRISAYIERHFSLNDLGSVPSQELDPEDVTALLRRERESDERNGCYQPRNCDDCESRRDPSEIGLDSIDFLNRNKSKCPACNYEIQMKYLSTQPSVESVREAKTKRDLQPEQQSPPIQQTTSRLKLQPPQKWALKLEKPVAQPQSLLLDPPGSQVKKEGSLDHKIDPVKPPPPPPPPPQEQQPLQLIQPSPQPQSPTREQPSAQTPAQPQPLPAPEPTREPTREPAGNPVAEPLDETDEDVMIYRYVQHIYGNLLNDEIEKLMASQRCGRNESSQEDSPPNPTGRQKLLSTAHAVLSEDYHDDDDDDSANESDDDNTAMQQAGAEVTLRSVLSELTMPEASARFLEQLCKDVDAMQQQGGTATKSGDGSTELVQNCCSPEATHLQILKDMREKTKDSPNNPFANTISLQDHRSATEFTGNLFRIPPAGSGSGEQSTDAAKTTTTTASNSKLTLHRNNITVRDECCGHIVSTASDSTQEEGAVGITLQPLNAASSQLQNTSDQRSTSPLRCSDATCPVHSSQNGDNSHTPAASTMHKKRKKRFQQFKSQFLSPDLLETKRQLRQKRHQILSDLRQNVTNVTNVTNITQQSTTEPVGLMSGLSVMPSTATATTTTTTTTTTHTTSSEPVLNSLVYYKYRRYVQDILDGISAELAGRANPTTNMLLETELTKYERFLMENCNMSCIFNNLTCERLRREFLLINLEEDLVMALYYDELHHN